MSHARVILPTGQNHRLDIDASKIETEGNNSPAAVLRLGQSRREANSPGACSATPPEEEVMSD